MKKGLKIISVILVLILCIAAFAGCKKQETKGSSSVMTQSEISDNSQYVNEDAESSDVGINSESSLITENSSSIGTSSADTDKKISSFTRPDTKKPISVEETVNKTGWPIVKNKITFEIMGLSLPSRGDPEMMSQFKYYDKLTNIKTKYIGVTESKYYERVDLAIKSGDMPDAFAAYSWSNADLNKFAVSNKPALVDVSGYLEDWAPNIKKVFDTDAVAKGVNTTSDGKIFILPQMRNKPDRYDAWLNIRKDLLIECGFVNSDGSAKIPTTADEFLEVMIAFNSIDYIGYPFAIREWDANTIMSFWGVRTTQGAIGIDRDGKVYYPCATKNAKAAVAFWNYLNSQKGMVYVDPFGINGGSFFDVVESGAAGCFVYSSFSYCSEECLERYVAIPYPAASFSNSEINVSASAQPYKNEPSRGTIVITSACENIPAMLRYWDYFYTADGVMLGNWGSPEGGNYRKNKDGTYTITNSEVMRGNADYNNAMGWAMGITEMNKVFPELVKKENYKDPERNEAFEKYQKEANKVYDEANKNNPTYYLPNIIKTAEEIARINKFKDFGFDTGYGAITSYVAGYWEISDFDNKVSEWNRNGLQEYIAEYQKIVDRNKEYLVDSKTYASLK